MPDLNPDELRRYARHLAIPEFGIEGQRRLKAARVLCIGAGGLGSPITMYLAAAGIGGLGLVDPDVVEVTNLQRQILFGQKDLGRKKLDAARERLLDINPHLDVQLYPERFTAENAMTPAMRPRARATKSGVFPLSMGASKKWVCREEPPARIPLTPLREPMGFKRLRELPWVLTGARGRHGVVLSPPDRPLAPFASFEPAP